MCASMVISGSVQIKFFVSLSHLLWHYSLQKRLPELVFIQGIIVIVVLMGTANGLL